MDESKIKLGEKYRDRVHGIEGVAISVHNYLHGCTRVTLQWIKDGALGEHTFDSPQLEGVTSTKTGGPRPIPGARTGE